MARAVKYFLTFTLTVLLLAPIIALMVHWISDWSWNFLNTKILVLLIKSIAYSGTIALISTLIGTVCGFFLAKLRIRFQTFYILGLLLPLLISPYIFAVAWKDIFLGIFGVGVIKNPEIAMILVHSLLFFPLSMILSLSAFSKINASLEESALMITPYTRVVSKILFPLIRPSIGLSFVLILIFSLSEFSVPAYLGVRTLTTEIFTQFSAFYNTQLAISQSILLLVFSLLLILSEVKTLSDTPFFSINVQGNRINRYRLGKGKMIVYILLNTLLFLAVLLPIFVLLYQSVCTDKNEFMRAYNLIAPALSNSLFLALLGASVIVVIGWWVAWLKERAGYALPHIILLITLIVPATVFGIAAIHFYNTPAGNFIYSSVLMLIIGYVAHFGFIASRIIANGYKQIPVSLEEAAQLAGVPLFKRYSKVVLPLLAPSLFSAFVLSFVLCMGELGLTIMVYPAGMELAGVKIYTIAANAPQALTDAMILINLAAVIFFVSLFVLGGKILFKKAAYE